MLGILVFCLTGAKLNCGSFLFYLLAFLTSPTLRSDLSSNIIEGECKLKLTWPVWPFFQSHFLFSLIYKGASAHFVLTLELFCAGKSLTIQAGLTGAITPTIQELFTLSSLPPNSSLTLFLSYPTRSNFSRLAPITKNIAIENFFFAQIKNFKIFFFSTIKSPSLVPRENSCYMVDGIFAAYSRL